MSECRRSVLSCARCRRRKIKCDRAIPCGQCIAAKSECTGFSSKDADPNIPRSIVQHLESEIAKVEGELARTGHLEELNASDILAGMPTNDGIPIEDPALPIIDLPITKPEDTPKLTLNVDIISPPAAPRDTIRDEVMSCGELQAMIFAILPT